MQPSDQHFVSRLNQFKQSALAGHEWLSAIGVVLLLIILVLAAMNEAALDIFYWFVAWVRRAV